MHVPAWLTDRGAAVAAAVAVLITCYGGLLRLDALVAKYGTVDHPAWARVLTHDVADLAPSVRPSNVGWSRDATPYVGGDPVNYLKYAREMRGFYQAHVREPVFLALTRGWLWALDDQEIALSFASLTGSTLAVLATYLVGSALGSRRAGLLAALLMAIEYEAIAWAPDGWRDDTFTATVLLAASSLIRLYRQPSIPHALLAGALCGLSCLTRITALSFVLPALVWLLAASRRPSGRELAAHASLAIGVLAFIVAPYLISCAIATGDPFYALNYHTIYYRHAEGQPITEPISAVEYVRTKLAARPVTTLDTALQGLFVHPFATKWNGFDPWIEGLDAVARGLAVAGLVALAFFRAGRLLLFVLLTSLIPYMLTWNVAGGRAWRFTMHAYPFYLVAAAWVVFDVARLARLLAANRGLPAATRVSHLGRKAGIISGALLVAATAWFLLPWLAVREAIGLGEATSVETGPRDRLFYPDGWSSPHSEGITVRVSRGERSVVRFPLPDRRDYDIVLRIDPVDPDIQQRVVVRFNGELVGLLTLSWNPERVGTYRVRARAPLVRTINELTIVSETLVSAGSAGPPFAWLDPDERIGLRLWYVRVLPLP